MFAQFNESSDKSSRRKRRSNSASLILSKGSKSSEDPNEIR